MAYLTFRQSDNTITDAQKLKKTVIKGVPLTMYDVDANFKAINDELVNLRTKFGIGAKEIDTDLKSVQTVFGSNDANFINASGIYRLTSTANVPSDVNANTVLIHAQNNTTALTDVSALQITASGDYTQNAQKIYFRTRQGGSTWNDWESFTTNSGLTTELTSVKNQINQKLALSGGTITGNLTVNTTTTLNGSNIIYSKTATKGSIPASNTLDGFTVYDKKKKVAGNTKLATFGLAQKNDSFSGVQLTASNPISTSVDQITRLEVGWKQDSSGTYQQVTYAPTPYSNNETNLIATTGWVNNQIKSSITENDLFGAEGGTITGNVTIEKELTVGDGFNVSSEGTFVNKLVVKQSASVRHSSIKPTAPSSVQLRSYDITDASGVVHSRYFSNLTTSGWSCSGIELTNWKNTKLESTLNTSSTKSKWIGLQSNIDGTNIQSYAPVPSGTINNSSTQIATAGWTNKLIDDKIAAYKTSVQDVPMNWDLGTL